METLEREYFLQQSREKGSLRVIAPVAYRRKAKVRINNKEYIDFSSNDYLGLSEHPRLIRAAKQALDEFGTSCSASRLMSGSLLLHQELEEKVARFKHKEAALVFNSGYQANLGIFSAFFGRDDAIFCDRLSHASLLDGCVLSGARIFRFRHNDSGHLQSLLEKERKKFKQALIVTESIFSMDGDRAPLKVLTQLKERYGCEIFVDEAHATGIFGESGSGLAEEEGLSEEIDFIMGTFSKALGGFGAYLACSRREADILVNRCRSFIYSTSLPAAVIAAGLASLEVIKDEPERRKKLLESSNYFRNALKEKGFSVLGDSQIIPLVLGQNHLALRAAGRLQQSGYWVKAIRTPTVPQNTARLRFSLSFSHDSRILGKVIDELGKIKI